MTLLIFVFLPFIIQKKKKNLKGEEKLLYPKKQNTIQNSKITKLSLVQKNI